MLSLAVAAVLWAAPADVAAQAGIPYLAEPDPEEAAEAESRAEESTDEAAEDSGGKRKKRRERDGRQEASDEGADTEVVPADEPAVEETAVAPAVPTVRTGPIELAALWQARRAALARRDRTLAAQKLEALVLMKKTAGWPNAFVYGEALARESRKLAAAGDLPGGVRLATAAVELAPDRAATHAALGAAYWARGGAQWAALRATVTAFLIGWREPPRRRAHVGNMILILLTSFAAAAGLFSLVALYRHSRTLVHDMHHVFPRGATRLQTGVLGVAILLGPIFFRLGVAWTVLVWVAAMGMYYGRRERISAVVVLVLLAGAPLMLPLVTAYVSYPGSRAEDAYRAVRDVGALAAVARIEGRVDKAPDELYILGLRAYWSGDEDRALERLGAAEKAGADDPELLVELGNLYFHRDEFAQSVNYYNKAVLRDDDHVTAHFNLWRAYSAMANVQKAGEAHRKATDIAYKEVENLKVAAKRVGPSYVAADPAPDRLLSPDLAAGVSSERAARHLWRLIGGKQMPHLYFTAAALACLVMVVVFGWLRAIARPSVACRRCGRPACRRCNPEMQDQKQCGQCYHAFVAKGTVDPQVRIKKEIEVHRFQARTAQVRRALSLLVAGTGQLLRGSAIRGLIFFTAFVSGILGMLISLEVVPEPVPTWSGLSAVSVTVAALVSIVAYGLGLWDVQRGEH